jgi:hypothetical protein
MAWVSEEYLRKPADTVVTETDPHQTIRQNEPGHNVISKHTFTEYVLIVLQMVALKWSLFSGFGARRTVNSTWKQIECLRFCYTVAKLIRISTFCWPCISVYLSFCWPCISVYLTQYLTNLMHKIFVLQ